MTKKNIHRLFLISGLSNPSAKKKNNINGNAEVIATPNTPYGRRIVWTNIVSVRNLADRSETAMVITQITPFWPWKIGTLSELSTT